MIDHRAADAVAPGFLGRVNRLQLEVIGIELFDGADSEQTVFIAQAEERHGDVEQTVEVEGMHVLGRGDATGEVEMPLQESQHIRSARIVDSHCPGAHDGMI